MKTFKALKNTLLVSTAVLIGLGTYGVTQVGNDDGLVEGPRSHKQAKHTEAKHEHARGKTHSSNGGAKSSNTGVVADGTDSAPATYDTQVDTVPYEPVTESSAMDTAVTSISNESVTSQQQQVTNEANAEAYQENTSTRDSPYLIDGVPATQDEARAYAGSIMQEQNEAIASSQAEQTSIDNNMKAYKAEHPGQFGTGN